MTDASEIRCTAFDGNAILATGDLATVAHACRSAVEKGGGGAIRIFDDRTGTRLDLQVDGTAQEVADRVEWLEARARFERTSTPARGRGRPKLGVVSREVTLLPRHWAWLDAQRGSASAALRRLVDEARKANAQTDRVRHAQDVAYRFMYDIAGNAPSFEEAIRALYAGDGLRFRTETESWASDVRDHARTLAADAFADDASSTETE
jgi:hypothetical protein